MFDFISKCINEMLIIIVIVVVGGSKFSSKMIRSSNFPIPNSFTPN